MLLFKLFLLSQGWFSPHNIKKINQLPKMHDTKGMPISQQERPVRINRLTNLRHTNAIVLCAPATTFSKVIQTEYTNSEILASSVLISCNVTNGATKVYACVLFIQVNKMDCTFHEVNDAYVI